MKSVSFDLSKNKVYSAYSKAEYNRMPIDSILYLRCYRKISDVDWNNMLMQLNYYKTNEMLVHIESIHNTKLHL